MQIIHNPFSIDNNTCRQNIADSSLNYLNKWSYEWNLSLVTSLIEYQ